MVRDAHAGDVRSMHRITHTQHALPAEEDVSQLSQPARAAAFAAVAGDGKLFADRLLAFAAVFLAEILAEVAPQRQALRLKQQQAVTLLALGGNVRHRAALFQCIAYHVTDGNYFCRLRPTEVRQKGRDHPCEEAIHAGQHTRLLLHPC